MVIIFLITPLRDSIGCSGTEDGSLLDELRSQKSAHTPGLWNSDSVLIGGLGKDPFIPDVTLSAADVDTPRMKRSGSSIMSKRMR